MCSIGCPNPRSVPSDSNATTSARRTFGSPVASAATTRVYEPDAVASTPSLQADELVEKRGLCGEDLEHALVDAVLGKDVRPRDGGERVLQGREQVTDGRCFSFWRRKPPPSRHA
jgi:hypothetical protein